MKIIFFGTSNVALPVLEALRSHHEIALVVTRPDAKVGKKRILQESPVSALARDLNLKITKPEKVKGNAELLSELRSAAADIFIVVSYGKILPEELLNIPRLKTINIHFSLLPKYRGAAPLQWALRSGETQTGTTIFILDKDLDHGPVLAQEKIAIDDDDTFLTLAERAAHKSAALLLNVLTEYEAGKITPKEQDHSQATFTKLISNADGKIDFSKTAQQINNQFRAFYPWPGIWTTWNGQVLKILACHAFDTSFANDVSGERRDAPPPGTVTEEGAVWCGGGSLLYVSELQLAGKNSTNIQSFLNGYSTFRGSQLQ